ncbi:MAG: aminomethyl-transferring glycine dehydrogenase subunit GcvPB [Pseudomonadota bacterium]
MLIQQKSRPGRTARAQAPEPLPAGGLDDLPPGLLRVTPPALPEVSELQEVRHYTRLSQQNFSIDTQFYPLGSCTMKYNPRGAQTMATLPGFLGRHPLGPENQGQGVLACLYELQTLLAEVTGMAEVSLSPAAGAQGEFAGVAMIRAYHLSRNDPARQEILIPDAAHGTNPASAAMSGFRVREIPTRADGDLDLEALTAALGSHTAGIMLTNPSTLGLFERRIQDIAGRVHDAGGLLYYDGANLNAILGKVRPGAMGFDVMHLNLHKTFATPHGGGGPGAGPVAANARLAPFLPIPRVCREGQDWRWETAADRPHSIGRLSAFAGNVGVLLRAHVYAGLLGREGLVRVAEFSTLNANYLLARLAALGFEMAYPERRASHEFILTLRHSAKTLGITAMDYAKRLLDFGIHAPTTYFPLIVPECLLIEPTETESREELDAFVDAMAQIATEAVQQPDELKRAPHTRPVSRLDEVKAARDLDIAYQARNRRVP